MKSCGFQLWVILCESVQGIFQGPVITENVLDVNKFYSKEINKGFHLTPISEA